MENKSKYKSQIEYAKRKGTVKISIDTSSEIREKFKQACATNNTVYTRVLKDFINDYIEKNEKK